MRRLAKRHGHRYAHARGRITSAIVSQPALACACDDGGQTKRSHTPGRATTSDGTHEDMRCSGKSSPATEVDHGDICLCADPSSRDGASVTGSGRRAPGSTGEERHGARGSTLPLPPDGVFSHPSSTPISMSHKPLSRHAAGHRNDGRASVSPRSASASVAEVMARCRSSSALPAVADVVAALPEQ